MYVIFDSLTVKFDLYILDFAYIFLCRVNNFVEQYSYFYHYMVY